MSKALSLSIFGLCFLYIIFVWDKIMLLIEWRYPLPLCKISRVLSVRLFCDKFKVITPPRYGSIFCIVSSLILFLINFNVLTLVPWTNSHTCIIVASPSYALVKSSVYSWSATKFYIICINFYGNFSFCSFFLFGF